MSDDKSQLALATSHYFDQLDSAALAEEAAIGQDMADAATLVDVDREI